MEATLYNQAGEAVGTVTLSDYVFGITPNVPVMHQALVRQQANARLGTHSTRGRGEVKGSTRKLYRQKGTGRARQGTIRAPHRPGGGSAHGPHPRSYEQAMPRKMRRLAVRSALSAKMADARITFVDELQLARPRTRDMLAILNALKLGGKTLVVLDQQILAVQKSASNLPQVKTLLAMYLNIRDLLNYEHVLISKAALSTIESWLGNPGGVVAAETGEDPGEEA